MALWHLRRWLFLTLMVFAALLSACNGSGQLPQPPVGGALQPSQGGATAAAMPSAVASAMPAAPTLPAGMTAPQGWQAVGAQATQIQQQGQQLQSLYQQIDDAAAWVQQHETDPDVLALASQMAELAAQAEQDAAQLAVTAGDINYRIDHSEGTTLRLSDDIGKMADRIGEMADRILWTELQIGVMADRIVHSEHLINDGTQQTIDQIQETLQQIGDLTRDVMGQVAAIQQAASSAANQMPAQPAAGQAVQPTTQAPTGETGQLGDQTGAALGQSPTGQSGQPATGAGGQPTGATGTGSTASSGNTGMGAGNGTTPATQPARDASVRRIEVLSRSIHLNAVALQESLQQARTHALALGQDSLADALLQAQQAAAQIALTAETVNTQAREADTLTPALIASTREAVTQVNATLGQLNTALQQANAAAAGLPQSGLQAQQIRRTLEAAAITTEYLTQWNAEIARIVGQ